MHIGFDLEYLVFCLSEILWLICVQQYEVYEQYCTTIKQVLIAEVCVSVYVYSQLIPKANLTLALTG